MERIPPKEKQGLLLYLIIANLWTWVLWISPLRIATREGYVLPSPDRYAQLAVEGFSGSRHVTLAIMFSLAVYGPLIGAMLALAFEQGMSGVRSLLANTFHMRIAPRWYLIAFSIAASIAFIPALIAWLTGSLSQHILDVGTVARLFVPLLVLQLLTSGLGEEPGWRGYLLPRLQRRFSAVRTVWVLGLIWAIWHYPLTSIYILQGVPDNAPPIGAVFAVLVGLLGNTAGVIGKTYIYVWLFNCTNSIFLMIVYHALSNTLLFLVPPLQGVVVLLVVVFPWVVVFVLQRMLGKEHFPGKPVPIRHPTMVSAQRGTE